MEQPKSAEDLGSLVELLKKQEDRASSNGNMQLLVGISCGVMAASFAYLAAKSDPSTVTYFKVVFAGLFGSLSFKTLIDSASYHNRSNLLNDRIAVLKASPNYHAHEGERG